MLDNIVTLMYIVGVLMLICFIAAGIQNVRDRLTSKKETN